MTKDSDNFFERVYQVAKLIPEGKVTSYGAIANYLGMSSGARMVGWAMNNSHAQSENVPAHRVVNRVGLLSGKNTFPSPFQMQALLEEEGIMVKDDQIENFDSVFWDPNTELDIER